MCLTPHTFSSWGLNGSPADARTLSRSCSSTLALLWADTRSKSSSRHSPPPAYAGTLMRLWLCKCERGGRACDRKERGKLVSLLYSLVYFAWCVCGQRMMCMLCVFSVECSCSLAVSARFVTSCVTWFIEARLRVVCPTVSQQYYSTALHSAVSEY